MLWSTSISATRSAPRIEVAHVAGRPRAHHLDDTPDRRHHARHPSEGEPRGDERHDLAIGGIRMGAMDELDGIGRRVLDVEGVVLPVEDRLQ
jgi:hypothetical protein